MLINIVPSHDEVKIQFDMKSHDTMIPGTVFISGKY